MEHLIKNWAESTKQIYTGVLLYSLLGILDSILSPIFSLANAASMVSAFAGGGGYDVFGADDAVELLIKLGIVAGYVMYFLGLGKFQPLQQSTEDSSAVGKIKTAALLVAVGYLLSFIPVAGGFLDAILSFVGFILSLMAFSVLKNSLTFPVKGKTGAAKIYTAMILQLIAVIIGWIPIVGGFFASILSIIAFIMILIGWAAIKDSRPHHVTQAVDMKHNMAGQGTGLSVNQGMPQTIQQQANTSSSPLVIQYMVLIDGQQSGPFSCQQLQQLKADHAIDESTFVWKQGMNNWEMIKNIAELSLLLQKTENTPPPPPSGTF